MSEGKKEKYLLLYLRTGGGHLAPARSIATQINKHFSNIEPQLVDGFENASFMVKAVVEGGYRESQHKAKWVYEMLYAIHQVKFIARFIAWIISLFVRPYLKELIKNERPSKIIIFHFFLIDPVYNVLKKLNADIKTYTVVTDPFTAHPIWFLKKNQNFIVFSEQLKQHCISKGIEASRLNVFPFILNEKFSVSMDQYLITELKKQYNLHPDKNVILILGGGDGIPKGEKILEIVLAECRDIEIIIVCGKNKRLMNNASEMKESLKADNLHIFGYVDFVYELINMSDIVITKCGASTSMEILISRKIPIVTDYIWGQEKGNKDFIERNGMGLYIRKLPNIPAAIKLIFTNRTYYKKNIEKAALRNGAEEVTRFLAS